MAEVIVNGDEAIQGRLTVNRKLIESEGTLAIVIEGILATETYIEEISEIETERLRLSDVMVVEESFGSEEKEIVYSFRAESLEVNT